MTRTSSSPKSTLKAKGTRRRRKYTPNLAQKTDSRWKKAVHLKNLGEIKEKQGLFDAASGVFERIWAEHPEVSFSDYVFELHEKNEKVFTPSPKQFVKRGEVMFEAGNWEEALSAFSGAPQTSAVRIKTGICLYRLSRFPEALESLLGYRLPEGFLLEGRDPDEHGERKRSRRGFRDASISLTPKSTWGGEIAFQGRQAPPPARRIRRGGAPLPPRHREISQKGGGTEKAPGTSGGSTTGKKSTKRRLRSSLTAPGRTAPSGSDSFTGTQGPQSGPGDKPGALFALGKLADSRKITYYSFLAKLRLKQVPPPLESTAAYSGNPFGKNPAIEKFLFFAKAGIYDLALREAELLRPQAKTVVQRIYLASLYLQARDYKSSINLADGLWVPRGATLLFSKGV